MKILKNLKKTIFEDETIRKSIMHDAMYIDEVLFNEDNYLKSLPSFKSLTIHNNFNEAHLLKIVTSYLNKYSITQNHEEFIQHNMERCNAIFTSMFMFYRYNQKILKLNNKALQLQLENTVINDIDFKDINVPFPSFYVSIQKNMNFVVTLGKESEVYIDGAFILNTKDLLIIDVIYENKIKHNGSYVGHLDNLHFELKNGGSINESIEKFVNGEKAAVNIQGSTFADNLISSISKYSLSQTLKTIIFFNIARNNREDLLIEEENKSIKLNKKNSNKAMLKKYPECNYTYILKNKSNKNEDINNNIKNTSGESKKNKVKIFVKGHYRKQPYGSKDNTLYKIIWIEPFLKGMQYEPSNKLNINVL